MIQEIIEISENEVCPTYCFVNSENESKDENQDDFIK